MSILPIPKHLRKILIPKGESNNEFKVFGRIRCNCCSEDFELLYVGDESKYINHNYVNRVEINGNSYFIAKAKCLNCNAVHELFDVDYHGWNGYICEGNGDQSNPRPQTILWECKECESTNHKIRIQISSKGKQDFLNETEGELPEELWTEAFDWITIGIKCNHCKTSNNSWTTFETM